MEEWLSRNRDVDDRVKRNVAGLRTSQDLFDDLSDGDEDDSRLAAALEMQLKNGLAPPGPVQRAFLYSEAIGYPFEAAAWQQSRYADGTFPVWYGSMTLDTSIHETGCHMADHEFGIEGLNEVIVRERAVYDVHCRALLIDLIAAQGRHAALTHPMDYSFTQALGKRVHTEGHSGLLAPSARDADGTNAVIFRQSALSDPRVSCYLRYSLDPRSRELLVERTPGTEYLRISYADTAFSRD